MSDDVIPRFTAAQRTDLLRAVLRERHPDKRYALLEEVGNGTGFGCQGWADALVLDLWPSGGLTLTGIEIKASREDLKKELANPKKAEKIAKYCDRWILVAFDGGVLKNLVVPEAWGVWILNARRDGFEIVQRGAKREPLPWSKPFVAAMLRAAQRTSPAAAFVARAVAEAVDRRREATSRSFRDLLARIERADDLTRRLKDEVRRLGGDPFRIEYPAPMTTRTGRSA